MSRNFENETNQPPNSNMTPGTTPLTTQHILATTPTHPRQTVQLLETSYGAMDFLPALKSFLYDHLPHNTVVPSHHDRFDVFCQVIIIGPADQCVISPK